jgi:replication factor C subunit 1
MDDYYLSKDDWDTIVEVGVGEFAQDTVLKQVPSATKAALTRKLVERQFAHTQR